MQSLVGMRVFQLYGGTNIPGHQLIHRIFIFAIHDKQLIETLGGIILIVYQILPYFQHS
jgi:hypothetical protein